MAVLIPNDRYTDEFNNSFGEQELYDKFNYLSDDYIIFHSVKWLSKKNKVSYGEVDYVIIHKKYGILCLEVKHGGIRGEDGRIYQINRHSKYEKQIKPMYQAENSKYSLIDIIKTLDLPPEYIMPINSCVWLTGISKANLKGILPNDYKIGGNTFFEENKKDIALTLENCYKFHKVKKKDYPEKVLKKLVDKIAPRFDVFQSVSNIVEENNYAFNRMTKEQTLLLDVLENQDSAAIHGGAGTGKTIMALEKAKRLSENEQVLFLCYNSMLVEYLNNNYSQSMPNVTFINLYKLGYKVYGREVSEEDILSLIKNFENFETIWKFKSIVVDEGQDFSNEQILALKEVAMLSEGSFYVFYDKYQLVQQRIGLKWLDSMECQLVLSYNCRNTINIAKTSSNVVGIKNVKTRLSIDGDSPSHYNLVNKNQIEKMLADKIQDYIDGGLNKNQIVILTTKTLEKSILKNVKYIGKNKITNHAENDGILFTTARKFKGLESDVVMLLDVDKDILIDEEFRRVVYVGASRAKSFLNIFSAVHPDDFLRIQKEILTII